MQIRAWTFAAAMGTATALAPAGAAWAAVIYDFTFTNGAQLDAQGIFSTGAASSQDPGYFLLTGVTFLALRDNQTGTLDNGILTQSSFEPGSAYNPTTEAFINHYNGGTYNDYGNGTVSGFTEPNNFGTSDVNSALSQGGGFNVLAVFSDTFFFPFFLTATYSDLLTITPLIPPGVPEPPSLALLGAGLLGLFGLALRRTA